MMSAQMIERMARAAHEVARARYPLLESWDALTPDRRAHQRQMAAHALGALTQRDVLELVARMPEVIALPAVPDDWALAELQEAAINDDGSVAGARRRYRSLLATAAAPLDRARLDGAGF
ncbi:hypothetical protein [Azorhizobium sp. AG788]|uniref:hypothetical protein n=1 Tax=Azorhizobium sp. AG788 TaxID=2183897 RepID=UPI003139E741